MVEMIANALRAAWDSFAADFETFLPRMLATMAIVLAGWLIAFVLAWVTRRVLGWVRFNRLAERSGAAELLSRADLPAADALLASFVFWLLWVGFLLSGFRTLGFAGMDELMSTFTLFVPRLLVAVIIVVVGIVVANFSWRAALLAGVNANLRSARLLASAVRFLIGILAIAMALEEIAVARAIVQTAFAIAFGAVMLGLAIALGIGGGPIARRLLEHQFPERSKPVEKDEISHL
jgi:hypothetical protein